MKKIISEADRKKLSDITENNELSTEVDKSLIAMFLKMTVEERLKSNDNMINAVTELRNAFRQG